MYDLLLAARIVRTNDGEIHDDYRSTLKNEQQQQKPKTKKQYAIPTKVKEKYQPMWIRRRSFDLGITFWSFVSLLLAAVVVAAAQPQLPFGDVNVIVVTDVHSWVGGHGKNEDVYNANYGHLLSFYERLKDYCNDSGRDLWFVMNGDWIDGTGLSVNGDPSHLVPLLEKMPWDVVNVSES
jgi:hypothetical protein